jgi:N-methylhydantoinase B
VRTPREREDDLAAQTAALETGARRLREIADAYGVLLAEAAGAELRAYSERMMRRALRDAPAGTWRFEDRLDDDGFGSGPILIRAAVTFGGGRAIVDLRRSADQVRGGVNAVRAITESCVLYVFRCLVGEDVPSNAGLAAPLTVLTRPGSVLDARPPAAVAAGNVETSQRIVDVLLGALARAMPGRIPAASQGSMNNLTLGGRIPGRDRAFAYYETIAGGMGARAGGAGASGVHSHMTNSLNTPVEALGQALPLRVAASTLRRGSGGAGSARGGEGIVRGFKALVPTDYAILSDRRVFAPYGLLGRLFRRAAATSSSRAGCADLPARQQGRGPPCPRGHAHRDARRRRMGTAREGKPRAGNVK